MGLHLIGMSTLSLKLMVIVLLSHGNTVPLETEILVNSAWITFRGWSVSTELTGYVIVCFSMPLPFTKISRLFPT